MMSLFILVIISVGVLSVTKKPYQDTTLKPGMRPSATLSEKLKAPATVVL
jgi:hypothetical protein